MKKLVVIALTGGLILGACKRKKSEVDLPVSVEDTTHYFQTSEVINKDIRELDSVPYYIYKLTTTNGKTDSGAVKTAAFKEMAQQFLQPDITSDQMKNKYKESIFEDRTLGGITFNYTALNKELEVQSVDILLKDDGETVKNIFIKKYYNYGDSSAIEQLSWKPEQRFQIVRSVKLKDGSENNYQTLVVWNTKTTEQK